jgi:putative FmdB family regulatory protein
MPIYEYACPDCRRIFPFLAKRVKPKRKPACPRCGNKKLEKEVSQFATLKGSPEPKSGGDAMPDLDSPRMDKFMREMERDMSHLDENNPKHMAHMMRKMQESMPADMMPKEMNEAIRRLESGEDPEKIEEDMGEVFDQLMGDEPGGPMSSAPQAPYTRDPGLYDM